ncbi:hypothetical protein RHSIM_Rhsim02G0120800 [Rhododendron simsii]|uniref:Lysine ketoglutarate reductase trans-splicing related 1 n=1 Tax=Rhododendron simsii TaxID=118357 RepID=A0A834HAH7_RHOSS|nr:hypothetical protein RHSIM_Rhsim02G0120800 [Rhododendron simsii]
MATVKSWRWMLRKRHILFDGVIYRVLSNAMVVVQGACGVKMKQLPFLGIVCTVMLFVVYRTTNYQYRETEMDEKLNPFYTSKDIAAAVSSLSNLPRGIIQARSDLELKPLWPTSSSRSKVNKSSSHNLLAIPVGINQKRNVDTIARKFLTENFTIILFHYDANVDGWWDLDWTKKAIHIVAWNQTKWWFAKRFLNPAVVSVYDYIFLWDEDLGVDNFHPGRYLKIVKGEGLEISQPALDPNSTGIHHRITIRSRTNKLHRRVWEVRGSTKCSADSEGPPCTGQICGRNGSSIFKICVALCLASYTVNIPKTQIKSQQHKPLNDLVHGWGMDMKLGYCAQGDRTRKVGVVDSEYIVHQGIQTLGGVSARKASNPEESVKKQTVDVRTEIRRQSTSELRLFRKRWEQAVKEDKNWVDPFSRRKRRSNKQFYQRLHI